MKLLARVFLFDMFLVSSAFAQACICASGCVPLTPTAAPTVTATRTATPTIPPSVIPPTQTPTRTPTPAASVRTVLLTESDAIFANPEIGLQTTRKTKAQVNNPRNIPLSMATFRTCAHQINPSPGVFDWSEFDNFLAAANAQGQTVQLGLIMYDPYDCSGWLKATLPSIGVYCSSENPTRTYYAPDWNSTAVQGAHRALIQAFAAKYNNDPRVDSVDVRSIGDYGEWHHSCLKVRSTNAAHPMPSEAARRAIIKDYHDYFTKKPLIHILDDAVSRTEAINRGAGWRADCWGGHHEDDLYPGWLSSPVDMSGVWDHSLVALEPCGGADALQSTSYMSIMRKVDEAIEKHASAINARSPIDFPDSQWTQWQRLLRKLGYRFVVRRYDVGAGTIFTLENVGNAPNYKPIQLKYGGEVRLLEKIMPGQIVTRAFTSNGGTLTAAMDVRPVQLANVEYVNGGIEVR